MEKIFTSAVILLQTAEVQMLMTTTTATATTTTTSAFQSGDCRYISYNFLYDTYRTKYRYCVYKCCGSYYNRYCCSSRYSTDSVAGNCSYPGYNYYYGKNKTIYKYCSTKCCGSYNNRYCCGDKDPSLAVFGTGVLVFFGVFLVIYMLLVIIGNRKEFEYMKDPNGVNVFTVQADDFVSPASRYVYSYPVEALLSGVNTYYQPPPFQTAPGVMPPHQPEMVPPPYEPQIPAGHMTNMANDKTETKSCSPPPLYSPLAM